MFKSNECSFEHFDANEHLLEDKELGTKLKNELPHILTVAVWGAKLYYKSNRNLDAPEELVEYNTKSKGMFSALGLFMLNCVTKTTDKKALGVKTKYASEIYAEYVKFCTTHKQNIVYKVVNSFSKEFGKFYKSNKAEAGNFFNVKIAIPTELKTHEDLFQDKNRNFDPNETPVSKSKWFDDQEVQEDQTEESDEDIVEEGMEE